MRAYLFLSLASLFWAGNFIVGRAMRGDLSPLALNFGRWSVAALVLLPLGYVHIRRQQDLLRREWRFILLLTATGVVAFQTLVYTGLRTTTAVNALLLTSTAPVAIVLTSWLVYRETITRQQGLGVCVSVVGAAVLIAKGDPDTFRYLQFNRGDLWILLAVLVWAAYSIALRRRPSELKQLTLLTATAVLGVILLLPLFAGQWLAGVRPALVPVNLAAVAYIGIFASVLAFFFWNSGVAAVGANRAGLFINLMPVFGALLSFLFLGEGLALFHVAGAVFVFAGIALMSRR